jgi:uncharacterized protein YbaR (Trm112 family)
MPVSCPKCETPLTAKRENQGELVRCPVCETKLQLPISSRGQKQASTAPSQLDPARLEPVEDPIQDAFLLPPAVHNPLDPLSAQANRPHANAPLHQVPSPVATKNGFQKLAEPEKPGLGLIIPMLMLGLIGIFAVIIVLVYKPNDSEGVSGDNQQGVSGSDSQPAETGLTSTEKAAALEEKKRSGSVQIWE